MTPPNPPRPLTFQESMELIPLPPSTVRAQTGELVRRYMSVRPPWVAGSTLYSDDDRPAHLPPRRKYAFGGNVYSQAGLVACRALEEELGLQPGDQQMPMGLHAIQGAFTSLGMPDRAFIYEATSLSTGRGFRASQVTARQPKMPTKDPSSSHFPVSDSELPLADICFTCIVSFKRSDPFPVISQNIPPSIRYASVLGSRPPSAWPLTPVIDLDIFREAFPAPSHGSFPIAEMRKVDMTAFNIDKPPDQRRELIFYRLLAPLPTDSPNSHGLVHPFVGDRNGLLMSGNHNGLGYSISVVGSLSYAFYVHVNIDQAVMSFEEGGDSGWWIQEAEFPRAAAGRVTTLNKFWSPDGVHVATALQDGLCKSATKEKL